MWRLSRKKKKEKEENQIRGLEKSWMMMEYNKRFASLPLRLPNLFFFFFFFSGTYSTFFPEKRWKEDASLGVSETRNAWPEDTESLILKHCRVLSSSKCEVKLEPMWSTEMQ